MSRDEQWVDGICNVCGAEIEEQPSNSDRDYMNRCTDPGCREHYWHYVYDDEGLAYYTHK